MDKMKAQLLRIQQQLAGLSASQKMLTASLVAIMLITLVWWAKSSGTSDLEPVLATTASPEEASKALGALQSVGITATLSGSGQIMVPSEQKAAALAALTYNGTVINDADPAKTLLSLISPLDGPQKMSMTKDAALEGRLAQVIKMFPGVQTAVVMLNSKSESRIGAATEPTASVVVNARKDQINTKMLTAAITNVVAHSVSKLTPKNVGVDINGQKQRTDDSGDDLASNEAEARIFDFEQKYEMKVERIVPPRSLIAIKAEMEDTQVHTETHAGNPETTVVKEKTSESASSESVTSGGPTGEPGAIPNSSVALPSASASAQPQTKVSTEKTLGTNEVYMGHTETLSDKMRGAVHFKAAAVRLAMSTMIESYKVRHGSKKDPTDDELNPFIKDQIENNIKAVRATLMLKPEDDVAVDVYYDTPATSDTPQEAVATATASIVSGYGKQAVLGLLAVASLFMVATMVKKGTPVPAIPMAVAPMVDRGPMTLNARGELAGIVNDESSGTLEGIELDEYQIKTTRVVEQVSNLVKENPEAAADLVKRWMSRT